MSFCLPIASLLGRAVYDPTMHDALPRTAAALAASPGNGVPDDAAFAAFVDDLVAAKADESLFSVAKNLNMLLPAARSHVLRTARGLSADKRPTRVELTEADPF